MHRLAGVHVTVGSDYCIAIKAMDSRLGVIFSLIDNNPQLAGRTPIVLTVLEIAAGRSNCVMGTGALPYATPPENIRLIRDYLTQYEH